MCSGSEAGSYSRLIVSVYHSTLGLRVIEKTKKAEHVGGVTPTFDLCFKLGTHKAGAGRGGEGEPTPLSDGEGVGGRGYPFR